MTASIARLLPFCPRSLITTHPFTRILLKDTQQNRAIMQVLKPKTVQLVTLAALYWHPMCATEGALAPRFTGASGSGAALA